MDKIDTRHGYVCCMFSFRAINLYFSIFLISFVELYAWEMRARKEIIRKTKYRYHYGKDHRLD